MNQSARTALSRRGLTLVEVAVAISLCAVMALVVATLLASGQKHWKMLYGRVHRQERVDAASAHRLFDAICRKSSCRKATLANSNTSLELYYWNDNSTSDTPENYARFYQAGSELRVEYGLNKPGTWTPDVSKPCQTVTVASAVQQAKFVVRGACAQMMIIFEDAKLEPLWCSAVRYNY